MPKAEDIQSYNFPEADSLRDEIRLIRLEKDFNYMTEMVHRHNYFELFYFSQGGGTHIIDFREHAIGDHCLHIVKPGALHLVKRDPGSSGYVLLFTKSFLYSLIDFTPATHMQLWQYKGVYPLSEAEDFFVLNSLQQIGEEIEKNRPEKMKVMASLLHMIFILMYRQAPDMVASSGSIVESFFDLLEDNFHSDMSASDYADRLNCSLKTLNEALKDSHYPPVTKNIQERKVLEAKRLMIHTDWSVKEIAYHLNFEDPDYFGKVFKSYTELSPTQFREQEK